MAKATQPKNSNEETPKELEQKIIEQLNEEIENGDDIFKGMSKKDKAKVISEMLMDAFKYSNEVLKQQKMHLNLFDERHPVIAAIMKNDVALKYIADFEKEIEDAA